jgi:hypothetical protein
MPKIGEAIGKNKKGLTSKKSVSSLKTTVLIDDGTHKEVSYIPIPGIDVFGITRVCGEVLLTHLPTGLGCTAVSEAAVVGKRIEDNFGGTSSRHDSREDFLLRLAKEFWERLPKEAKQALQGKDVAAIADSVPVSARQWLRRCSENLKVYRKPTKGETI